MKKTPFLTLEQAQKIIQDIPTPFHVYDEAGIRRNARALKEAFSWNKGFREYFAVKATPNPYILQILQEEGCGCDCASYTELLLAEAIGATGHDIMFSSNVTPEKDMRKAVELGRTSILTMRPMWSFWRGSRIKYRRRFACGTTPAALSLWATPLWICPGMPSTA